MEREIIYLSQWCSEHGKDMSSSYQVMIEHLQMVTRAFRQHEQRSVDEAMHQLVFLACNSALHVTTAFLSQWDDVVPKLASFPIEKRVEYLRYTKAAHLRK